MSTFKSPWFWLVAVALLVAGYLLWARRKTVIVKPAPVAVPPAPSSVNSALALGVSLIPAATSIFEAFSSDDSDD